MPLIDNLVDEPTPKFQKKIFNLDTPKTSGKNDVEMRHLASFGGATESEVPILKKVPLVKIYTEPIARQNSTEPNSFRVQQPAAHKI